jgi:hypothetical protein
MKRQWAGQVVPLLALMLGCVGCNRSRQGPTVLIQIANQESTMVHVQSVAALRKEILGHVKEHWDRGSGAETEWIRVYSGFGREQMASELLGVSSDKSLTFVSERSTAVFRIRQERETRSCVVETQNTDGSVTIAGQSSGSDWPLLEAILLSTTLNDSILQCILDNQGW